MTIKGESASPSLIALIWAPTWGLKEEDAYETAGCSAPSMAMNSMQRASAWPLPFAPAPKTAKLRVYETQEINGLIFAWWGTGGRAPHWSLPAETLELEGWGNSQITTLRFAGHPQETTENVVDLAHLRYVHGYDNVTSGLELAVDGPYLEAQFDFKRVRKIVKVANLTFECSARAHIFGLGYSFVQVHEQSIGMDLRLWVLATPVDGKLIDLTLVSQVKEMHKPKRMFAGLGFLPTQGCERP